MIMLIVAFAASLFVPAMPAFAYDDQTVIGMAMTTDNGGICTHDSCPVEQQADMQGACFASGAGPSVLSQIAGISYFTTAQGVLTPSLDRALVDRTVPPDLRPPKQV